MLECTASVRIATDPVSVPAITLSRISAELDATDSSAVRFFRARRAGRRSVAGHDSRIQCGKVARDARCRGG